MSSALLPYCGHALCAAQGPSGNPYPPSALQVLCDRCSSSRHSTDKCPLEQFYEQQAPSAGPPPRKLSTAEKTALYAGEGMLLQFRPVQGIEVKGQPPPPHLM